MKSVWQVALVAALLALPVLGQDSVSKNLGGLPGDALSPWNATQQCANFVVDTTPFRGSWGTRFELAPLFKSGRGSFYNSAGVATNYFNSLQSAQSLSRLHVLNTPYAAASYGFWTAAGQGVNATMNNAPGVLSPTGASNQFGVVSAEFGYSAPSVTYSGIVGAVVNYDPSRSARLYVRRVMDAVNNATPSAALAQYGIGAVDGWGNAMFRCDLGSGGTNQNIFNVNSLARACGALNVVSTTGATDGPATTWILQNAGVVHNTPNIGPQEVFGVPYYLGSNFTSQYVYGATSPPAATTAHFAASVVDHRGALAYMSRTVSCIGGTMGTAGILAKAAGAGSFDTKYINVWGLNAGGVVAPGSPNAFLLPATVTDNVTGVSKTGGVFDYHYGNTAYSGGNSQVALGVDQTGRLIAAAGCTEFAGVHNSPSTYIVAVRTGCPITTPEWSIVAYSSDSAANPRTGKPILNGPGGAVIGYLTTAVDSTGGTLTGVSTGPPMIDSVGNVWFMACVSLDKTPTDPNYPPYIDTGTALIRAVYNGNYNGTGLAGWELEKVLDTGDAFLAKNSNSWYQVRFLNLPSNASAGVANATCWSSNIAETGSLGLFPSAALPTKSPLALGGLALNATIVYDINNDFEYNDPTSSYYDPNYPQDEGYSVEMYIKAGCRVGDGTGDGVLDNFDINPFVQALSSKTAWMAAHPGMDYICVNDINGDGVVDNFDINPFVYLLAHP